MRYGSFCLMEPIGFYNPKIEITQDFDSILKILLILKTAVQFVSACGG